MIGQPVIEKAIASRLDGHVHYGEQVSSISEEGSGDYPVEVATASGRRIRSRYAIGADGARSMIRSALGLGFTGSKPEMLWAVLDTFIETDFPTCPEIITFELNGQSRVAWIPRERGMCRFYVLLEGGDVTQERAEESIKQHMAPHSVEFKKTEWFSTFDGMIPSPAPIVFRFCLLTRCIVKERIASSFVSKDGAGRVLLAGDAAHVHSVNGGQGLNTGIADAFALSWRVAMALGPHLKPGASDVLIRSYDIERRTTAQEVIGVAATLVRDTVCAARQYVSTIEKNAAYITGKSLQLHSTTLCWDVSN